MRFPVISILAIAAMVQGCKRADSDRVQGYVEGEYVYVACPTAGALKKLAVERGTQVKADDTLFWIEDVPELAARDEAAKRLAQAKATLADTQKGRRPSEIESLQAQLGQAKASLAFSTKEKLRQESLAETAASSVVELDRAKSTFDQDTQRVAQMEADLLTARLGEREDTIAAAEANVRALEAALTKAEWDLSQKHQNAPQAGVVFDTLYRPGEWVGEGKPVVAILPPANVKVRAFIPQDRASRIKLGDQLKVSIDGRPQAIIGKVSFISPKVEFTPPVIYGQESRGKLVFMIELVFDAQTSADLHPGQPVDVRLEG